jgi:pSer/pThr/pTyr-binding forkhead associated (FHA) protein
MEVRFVVEKGGRKRILYMREPQGVIGRAKGNTVRIPSADVSRQHCRLRVVDGVLEVEDLDSVNGTFLNSGKVQGWQAVRPGDKLEVGPVKFVIEYELTPRALEQLKKKGGQVSHVGMSMLEGLADGSVVDADAIDDLEIIDAPAAEEEALPMLELAEEEALSVEDDFIRPDFNIDDDLQMPDGSEFRDLLSQMDDDIK